MGSFKDFIIAGDVGDDSSGESTLKNREEYLVEESLHDNRGLGVVTIRKGKVVDSNTPLPVVLLEGVRLGLEVLDLLVFEGDFILKGRNLVIGILEEFFQRFNFGRKGLQGRKFGQECFELALGD